MQKTLLITSLLAWAGLSLAQGACSHETEVLYTFYGFPDNTPPGANVAFTCDSTVPVTDGSSDTVSAPASGPSTTTKSGRKGRKSYSKHRNVRRGATPKARGTGSYADPLTMAGATKYFKQCEIVYSPFLQKYLRYEDTCTGCEDSADKGIVHVDIWTGSTTTNQGSSLLSCENSLTPKAKQSIVRSPPANLPVDSSELYSGTCNSASLKTVLAAATSFC